MQIREFRQRLHLLLTEPETAVLDDEAWWEQFGEVLDDVLATRAHAKRDATRARRGTQWAAWTAKNPPAHVDTSEFDDPDNG